MIQTIDDGVDVQNRFPVLPQNIEANISFQINIWMINLHPSYTPLVTQLKEKWIPQIDSKDHEILHTIFKYWSEMNYQAIP